MFVGVLTVVVSRHSMFLALFMLAVVMVVGRLMVMMSRSVMMSGSLTVMLDGRVLRLFCHVPVLLERFRKRRRIAPEQGLRSAHP
jgi:hypothetical protein